MNNTTTNTNKDIALQINEIDAFYQRTMPVFNSLLDAMQKSVSIKLDNKTLTEMKHNAYKLCFAKKVGTFDYNVVWQSYSKYLANNKFSWLPMYSVFGSNNFETSVTVDVSCDPVAIGLGQRTTLDRDGVLSAAVDGGHNKTALNIINEYGKIHLGVSQLSYGIDGQQIATPIYLAQQAAVSGAIELTPKEKVLIWFEQDIETSTIFSGARSTAIEVDMTFDNEIKLAYSSDTGEWSKIG